MPMARVGAPKANTGNNLWLSFASRHPGQATKTVVNSISLAVKTATRRGARRAGVRYHDKDSNNEGYPLLLWLRVACGQVLFACRAGV